MNNEYGVACLLDDRSSKELNELTQFVEKGHLPHVSLFQFKCTDTQLLSLLNEYNKGLVISNQFSTKAISQVENNIFMDVEDDSTLKAASDKLAEFYFLNFRNKEPLSQILITELDAAKLDLTTKYGIYWIKNNFRPHVTLLYNEDLNNHTKLKIPEIISVLPPQIYPIDNLGRILN